jgi:acetyl esterase/lipase
MTISPLEAAMAARLDPEYRDFYNVNLADKPGLHEIPWHPSIRDQPAQPGGSQLLNVGSVRDIKLDTCSIRVFTPEGNPPPPGWPVFLFFHGGSNLICVEY